MKQPTLSKVCLDAASREAKRTGCKPEEVIRDALRLLLRSNAASRVARKPII